MIKYGILILAAGASARLGRPKQLLEIGDDTLISHVVAQCLNISSCITQLVTGQADKEIRMAVQDTGVKIIYNEKWAEGMGTSISTGIRALLVLEPDIEACIIAVSDQPYICSQLLSQMISTFESTQTGIIASHYADTLGTPVLLDKRYFEELLALRGDSGAKRIIQKYQTNVTALDFPKGDVDIDTEEDYLTFISGR